MDTYMSVVCYGKDSEAAAEAAIEEIERIDALLSIESESGSVRRVNDTGSAAIDRETELIVEQALAFHSSTGGAFDITVLPLMELWGFTSGNFRVPESGEIDAALDRVGSGKLSLTNGVLSLGGAAGIDLGGIAKGYTSDRLMELLRSRGIESACVSLGGNVQCLGSKSNGSAWRCGIVHPFKKDSGEYLGIIAVKDKAVITSGAYERNFTDKASGKLYHHIIDPKSGYPAESDLSSVTIVSQSGILADALSTACYIMGLEGAIEYWRSGAQSFEMILMSSDGSKVYVTPALADAFSTDCMLEIISQG
ncbi:MAG: FAD:protein FMN transferase [Clostridia bacterium]|nr:FAD:protein FMN transferase [Clostridia bacterium]